MFPPTLCCPRCDIHLMLIQEIGESVIYLKEAPMENAEMLVLHDDALAELLEAFDDEGDCTGVGALAEGFFPFFLVVGWVGTEEGGGVRGISVVEVGVEGGVGGVGVPFGEDEFDLVGYGLLTCMSARLVGILSLQSCSSRGMLT